mmetsp:Transcript_12618/g.27858  ORF Transcript_12618/g.27858 Transcript_12618/m.27858 type:complete len:104 (+) Transcript_12618:110-421(+)
MAQMYLNRIGTKKCVTVTTMSSISAKNPSSSAWASTLSFDCAEGTPTSGARYLARLDSTNPCSNLGSSKTRKNFRSNIEAFCQKDMEDKVSLTPHLVGASRPN